MYGGGGNRITQMHRCYLLAVRSFLELFSLSIGCYFRVSALLVPTPMKVADTRTTEF